MIGFQVDLNNLQNMITKIGLLKARLNDRSEPLERIKSNQNKRWDANFTAEGRLYDPWAPLTAFTRREKAAKGFGNMPLLVRTGTLSSWVNAAQEDANVGMKTLTWIFKSTGSRTDGSYAVFHSQGYHNTWAQRFIAPRVLWKLDSRDEQNAVDTLDQWIDEKVKEIID